MNEQQAKQIRSDVMKIRNQDKCSMRDAIAIYDKGAEEGMKFSDASSYFIRYVNEARNNNRDDGNGNGENQLGFPIQEDDTSDNLNDTPVDYLFSLLSNGDVSLADITKAFLDRGFNAKQMYDAKNALHVVGYRSQGVYYWHYDKNSNYHDISKQKNGLPTVSGNDMNKKLASEILKRVWAIARINKISRADAIKIYDKTADNGAKFSDMARFISKKKDDGSQPLTAKHIIETLYTTFNHAPQDEFIRTIFSMLGRELVDNSTMNTARRNLKEAGFIFIKQPNNSWLISIDQSLQKAIKEEKAKTMMLLEEDKKKAQEEDNKKLLEEQRKEQEQLTIKMEQERIEREKEAEVKRQLEEDIKFARTMIAEMEAKWVQLRG